MPTYVQLASDNFQRANETPLSGSGNWYDLQLNNTYLVLFNNQVFPNNSVSNNAEWWNPSNLAFPNDQYAEAVIDTLPSSLGNEFGVLCRAVDDGTGRANGYAFKVQKSGSSTWAYVLQRFTSIVPTTLVMVSNVAAPVIGDVIRLEVQGNKITGFYNGVQKAQATDSTYTSGQPGIIMTGASSTRPGTNSWDAGSIIQNLNLNVTLFQNYFSPSVFSDPISVSTIPVVFGTITNFVPITLGVPVAGFGVSPSNPIEIDGYSAATQLFGGPNLGPFQFGTANSWGSSASGLLTAPGGGSVGNHTYYVVAGGDISTDAGTRTPWSLICRLRQGGGRGSYWTRADSIVGGSPVLTSFPNRNRLSPAQLQLSLGINFSSVIASPVVRLMQFEIQELP